MEGSSKRCSSSGCPSLRYQGGLCKAHWRRATGEKTGPVKHYVRNQGNRCSLVCDKPAHILGLCKRHYRRKREGREDWSAPLAMRAENHALAMGRVRVRRKYAEFYRELSSGLGMTLNALATYLLEEYAQTRLNEKFEDDEPLTRDQSKRK